MFLDLEPYPTGDAAEYVLTTEAFKNHLSPSINKNDFSTFKTDFLKKKEWWSIHKPEYFDQVEQFLSKEKKEFKETFAGIYLAKNGSLYSYHFPFYSLLNLPARILCVLLNKNPLGAFQLTNGVLILLTCALILLTNLNISLLWRVLISTSFFFSSVYWYIGWVHPEVMTACFVAASLWLLWQNRFLLSLYFMIGASLQNQPLVLMVALIAILFLAHKNFNKKSILLLIVPGLITLLPSAFYFVLFDTFNLVKDQGFLSKEVVTFTRVFGFFFDINQGIILAIPFAITLFPIAFVAHLRDWRDWKNTKKLIPLPLVLSAMVFSFCTMKNWNHGQAVIVRYGVWFSTIVLLYVLIWMSDKRKPIFIILGSLIGLSQIVTTLYHEKLNKFDWTWFEHKPIAKYVLGNFPDYYNPDPHIFFVRTTGKDALDTNYGPVIFKDDFDNIKKIMLHKSSLNSLAELGFDTSKSKKIFSKVNLNGWVYLNPESLPYLDYEVIDSVRNKNSIDRTIERIKATPEWMDQIKIKAAEKSISLDSMILLDAIYILNQEK